MKRCLLLSLLSVVALAQDDELYRHPGGYFTLRPEKGWTVESEPHAARLKKRSCNIAVLVLPRRMAPDAAIQEQVGRLAPNFQKFQQTGSETVKVAGIATRSLTYLGTGGEMPSVFVRIMPVDFPAHTIVAVSLATTQDYLFLRDEIRIIEESLAPGLPAAEPVPGPAPARLPAPVARPAAASLFPDPGGRFQVPVPAGWTAAPAEGGARLSRGAGYVNVMWFEGSGGGWTVAKPIIGQVSRQWRGFRAVDQGQTQLGPMPATYGVFSGVNPRGVPATLKVVAAAAPAGTFVLLMSAPQSEMGAAGPAFQAIEAGFDAGGGAPAAGGPVPAEPGYPQPAGPGPFPGPSPGSAVLGVNCRNLTPEDMATVAAGTTQGALVMQVGPGTPAEQAGIRPGDVIVVVDGRAVLQFQQLVAVIGSHRPGDTVEIMLARQGRPMTVRARLEDRSAGPAPQPAPAVMPPPVPVPTAPSQPVPPSSKLLPYQGPGFSLSVPDNWIGVLTNSRRIVRFGAEADLRPLAGREDEVPLGGSAGWAPIQAADVASAAEAHLAELMRQNPGARVAGRHRITVGGLPAESLLVESICSVLQQPQLTWILVLRPAAGPFFLHLGGPKTGFDALRPLFGSIVGSLRFR